MLHREPPKIRCHFKNFSSMCAIECDLLGLSQSLLQSEKKSQCLQGIDVE